MLTISRTGQGLRRGLSLWLLAALLIAGLAARPAVSLAAPSALPARDAITYTVQPGDSLRAIAARYGVTIGAIVRANNLVNPDVIFPGQQLLIPVEAASVTATPMPGPAAPPATAMPVSTTAPSTSSATAVPPPATPAGAATAAPTAVPADTAAAPAAAGSTRSHTVQLGDTLDKLARQYGVTAAAITEANGIRNPDLIWVGQKLVIPAATAPQPTATQVPAVGPTIYTVKSGDTLSQIAQRFGTTVAAIVAANGLPNANNITVGMRLKIPKAGDSSGASVLGQPTKFVVSISQQRCWLYRGDVVITKWVCSTGRAGSGTRTGTFRIQSKMAKAYGSTWNIWMPYWLGIYWAGASENGIHGLPWNAKTGVQVWTGYVGTPITYGCVMLDNVNAKMLYDVAYIGMPVVIKP